MHTVSKHNQNTFSQQVDMLESVESYLNELLWVTSQLLELLHSALSTAKKSAL